MPINATDPHRYASGEETSSPLRGDPDRSEATGGPPPTGPAEGETVVVEEEILVEEISIDGMCGVY